jgi:hypothetical protein
VVNLCRQSSVSPRGPSGAPGRGPSRVELRAGGGRGGGARGASPVAGRRILVGAAASATLSGCSVVPGKGRRGWLLTGMKHQREHRPAVCKNSFRPATMCTVFAFSVGTQDNLGALSKNGRHRSETGAPETGGSAFPDRRGSRRWAVNPEASLSLGGGARPPHSPRIAGFRGGACFPGYGKRANRPPRGGRTATAGGASLFFFIFFCPADVSSQLLGKNFGRMSAGTQGSTRSARAGVIRRGGAKKSRW